MKATVTLTNAEILALPTAPKVLVAAPGAGKMIAVSQILLMSNFAEAYTNIDEDGYLTASFTGGFDQFAQIINDPFQSLAVLTAFLERATPYFTYLPHLSSETEGHGEQVGGDLTANATNVPLLLILNNDDSGNLTGGDPANTLKVVVWYDEVDV